MAIFCLQLPTFVSIPSEHVKVVYAYQFCVILNVQYSNLSSLYLVHDILNHNIYVYSIAFWQNLYDTLPFGHPPPPFEPSLLWQDPMLNFFKYMINVNKNIKIINWYKYFYVNLNLTCHKAPREYTDLDLFTITITLLND